VCLDNERLIHAAVWPLEEDLRESLARLSGDLRSLLAAGLVARYEVAGKRYLFIVNWDEHQKVSHPGKPRYPRPTPEQTTPPTSENTAPPETLATPSGESPEDSVKPHETLRPEQGAGSREKGAGILSAPSAPPQKAGKTNRATRIPDDFTVTPDMVEWARTNTPAVDGRRETEKFINYWRAKAGKDATKLDWKATWRNWMLNAAERTSPPPQPNGSQPAANKPRCPKHPSYSADPCALCRSEQLPTANRTNGSAA
jgi:hypothetical protein